MGHQRRIQTQAAALAVGLGLTAMVGCAAEPRPTWRPQPEPLALSTAPARPAPDPARPAGRLPWYAIRNEVEPAVNAGLRLPVLEESHTVTVDRQHISNGRVHDHFRTTTYRDQHRRTVR